MLSNFLLFVGRQFYLYHLPHITYNILWSVLYCCYKVYNTGQSIKKGSFFCLILWKAAKFKTGSSSWQDPHAVLNYSRGESRRARRCLYKEGNGADLLLTTHSRRTRPLLLELTQSRRKNWCVLKALSPNTIILATKFQHDFVLTITSKPECGNFQCSSSVCHWLSPVRVLLSFLSIIFILPPRLW